MMRAIVRKSANIVTRFATGGGGHTSILTKALPIALRRGFADGAGKDAKSKAYEELLKTYNELGDESSPIAPMAKPPTAYLKEKMSQPMAELTLDELDAIAAVCFTGDQAEDEDDPIPQDVGKAISIWSETAMKGSATGLYQMGALQYEGVHMDKSLENAFDIFEQLVEEHSHPMSKYMLGVMFSKGEGCEKCDLTAFEYFKQASGDGILPAFHNVANYYMSGIKRNPDHVDRTVGGTAAADRGSGGGGGATGPAERGGADGRGVTVGVPRDFNAALKYYEFGANHGDPHSCLLLAHWYSTGFSGTQTLMDEHGENGPEVPIKVAQDVPQAITFYQRATQIGHPIATFNLAVWYMNGITSTGDVVASSAEVDMAKALTDDDAAVSGGGAATSTGEVLIKPDIRQAIELFDRSSRLGYPQATMNLGQIYRHGYKDHSGNVVERDVEKAIEVFSRHAGGRDTEGRAVEGFAPVAAQLTDLLEELKKK